MKILVTNDCFFDKISQSFLPIIQEAIEIYLDVLTAKTVKDIRLMGSVPRGDARLYHSDIDFVAICTRSILENESRQIIERAAVLSAVYKHVRKVDLELEVLGRIGRARDFIFRTDSISIYGENQYSRDPIEIEATEIAETITPDIEFLISEYREGLRCAKSPEERVQFSRWIGKDILKSMRRKLLVEKSVYAKSPKEITRNLRGYFPEYTAIFTTLLSAYIDPTSDSSILNCILNEVEKLKTNF